MIAIAAARGASLSWAVGAFAAHRPASLLGPFEMARVQLIAASILLLSIVTVRGTWHSVDWSHWPALAFASVIGVAVANCRNVCLHAPRRATADAVAYVHEHPFRGRHGLHSPRRNALRSGS